MNPAEREIVRKAELAAMGPRDAVALLADVCLDIRRLVNEGDLHAADGVLAGMTSGTARLISLALAGDIDRRSEDPSGVADLIARKEREFIAALVKEDARLDLAREQAEKIAAAGNQRFRDQAFIRKLQAARVRRGGDGAW